MLLIVLLLLVMMYLEQHLLLTRLLWLLFVFCRSWSNTIHFFIFNSYRHCGADGTIDKSISPWFDSLLQSRISVASQPPYSSYNDIQLKMMSSQSSWKILLIQTPSWSSSTLTLHASFHQIESRLLMQVWASQTNSTSLVKIYSWQ